MTKTLSLRALRGGSALVLAVLLSTLGIVGCGDERSSSDELDLSVLRSVHYDYIQFPTPEALASFVDLVAVGAVEAFADGLEVETPDNPTPDKYVIMSVRVERLLKVHRQAYEME